jgi:hypothetical protein
MLMLSTFCFIILIITILIIVVIIIIIIFLKYLHAQYLRPPLISLLACAHCTHHQPWYLQQP